MILTKTTSGVVVQVEWEDQQGDRIEDGQYGLDFECMFWPLDMKQPE